MVEGRYIVLEGAEGCGKSTHAGLLAAGLGAVLTFEPGASSFGKEVRAVLADPANTTLTDEAEALLIAADRAQHLAEVVRPALAAGHDVVSDRSVYSSLAYQGYGRGLPLDMVRAVNEWAIGGRWPDLVVLMDVPDNVLARRLHRRDLDRFEQAGDDFHQRVREGYAALAAAEPNRWVVIDGRGPRAEVAARIRAAVDERLPR